MRAAKRRPIALGIRQNASQVALLVGVNALVGGTLGQERTILPLLASRTFGLTAFTAALSFVIAFGLSKAMANLAAGALADRYGRKPVLVAGWLVSLPVPFTLIWAPSWGWVVAANILLGVGQGLTWSAALAMKVDLAGPSRRGLVTGLNEAAGYAGLSLTALATGLIAERAGLRPEPFFLGIACVGLGLGASVLLVRETQHHVRHEARRTTLSEDPAHKRTRLAATQAGTANNLNDAVAWGLFPLLFASRGLPLDQVGLLVALYPGVWGFAQVGTGALSDRLGRKTMVVTGMWLQAAGLAVVGLGASVLAWAGGTVVLGLGTALAYPTLLAVVGDTAHPSSRATSMGVYRFWRDLGFAIGGLASGLLADGLGLSGAIVSIAALTFLSGVFVASRMAEMRTPRAN